MSPLAGLTNLTEVYLQGNPITDFSPLAGLPNLTYLHYDDTLIPDAHLRSAIAAALGRESDAPITVADMETLTKLGSYLSDLTGLEFAINLTVLSLRGNITDVSPLAGLTNLTSLSLEGNSLTDVSPLSSLTNLTGLYLEGNSLTDVSPLSSLTNLTELYLEGNSLTDVSPLAGLTNLTTLDIEGNSLTDVSPLSGLTNLTRLDLYGNSLTDVSLSNLPNLTRLDLYGNSLTDVSLSNLPNLTKLYLLDNRRIADVSLSGLTLLPALSLQNNAITDVSLSNLPNLAWLDLQNNAITDMSLSNLPNLTELFLQGNAITDVSPLSALSGLTNLDLQGNAITDVSPLSALSGLTNLDLQGNKIVDIAPLSGLTSLTELYLQGNAITDVSPLSALSGLTNLDLRSNKIVDIAPLSGLTNLTELFLQGNPLNVSSIDNHIAVLESRGTRVSFYSSRQSQGDFNIELVFLDLFTGQQQRTFEYAARRWMSIITEDLPDYEFTQGWSGECGDQPFEIPAGERIDDLRIYVSFLDDDDRYDGRGGPTLLRETHLPVVGCVKIKSAWSGYREIGLHEIGHVLGVGTIWHEYAFGLLHALDGDTHFNGPLAIAAFDDAGGWDYDGAKVPVEQNEDIEGAHWRYSVFGNEIMQGRYAGTALSAITIQTLADFGYGVDVTQADAYTLPSAAQASAKVAATHAEPELLCGVGDGEKRAPIYVVDQQGYIIRTIGD